MLGPSHRQASALDHPFNHFFHVLLRNFFFILPLVLAMLGYQNFGQSPNEWPCSLQREYTLAFGHSLLTWPGPPQLKNQASLQTVARCPTWLHFGHVLGCPRYLNIMVYAPTCRKLGMCFSNSIHIYSVFYLSIGNPVSLYKFNLSELFQVPFLILLCNLKRRVIHRHVGGVRVWVFQAYLLPIDTLPALKIFSFCSGVFKVTA